MGSYALPALDVKAPQQQASPLEQYGQLMALKNAQQQSQLNQQEAPLRLQALQQGVQTGQVDLQEKQQQQKDQQAVTAAMQSWDGKDYNDILPLAIKNGASGQAVIGLKKNILDQQTQVATAAKNNGDAAVAQIQATTKKNDLVIGALSPLLDANKVPDAQLPQVLQSTVQSLVQQGALDQQHAQAAAQLSQSGDPASIRAGVKQFSNTLMAQSQISEEALKQSQTNSAQAQADKDTAQTSTLKAETAARDAWLTKNPGKTAADYDIHLAGARAGAEESARLPGEMALARQRQALSQGDPKAAAALLVSGDATLSELKARGATPEFIANTLNAAHELSGGKYNAQAADAQFDVAKSPTNVAFFGSAKSLTNKGGTLDQLEAAGKNIPGGLIPAFNSIADWEKAATGSGPIAKYAAIALGASDDFAKVMGSGTGSDASRLQALKVFGANQSPEQRAGSIEGVRGAVGSQIESRIGNNPVLGRMYGTPASQQGGSAPSSLALGSAITQNGHQYKVTGVDKNGKPTSAEPVQ